MGNCVAKRNYRYFYLFLVTMTIGTVYVMGCNVAVIVIGVLPFRGSRGRKGVRREEMEGKGRIGNGSRTETRRPLYNSIINLSPLVDDIASM